MHMYIKLASQLVMKPSRQNYFFAFVVGTEKTYQIERYNMRIPCAQLKKNKIIFYFKTIRDWSRLGNTLNPACSCCY